MTTFQVENDFKNLQLNINCVYIHAQPLLSQRFLLTGTKCLAPKFKIMYNLFENMRAGFLQSTLPINIAKILNVKNAWACVSIVFTLKL